MTALREISAPSVERHTGEPNNILVNLPKGINKKISLNRSSHTTINWNKVVNPPLHRLNFRAVR